MSIELTTDQARALAAENGSLVVIDPTTQREYRLILLPEPVPEVPPGVRMSREALWRELPELLKVRKNRGLCVCYHGNQRVGMARYRHELQNECARLGIPLTEYYIGIIEEQEFIEEEEIESFRPDLVESPCPSS